MNILRKIAGRRNLQIALAMVLLAFGAKTNISRIDAYSPRYSDWDFYAYYAWGAEYSAGEALWTPAIATGDVRPGLPRVAYCNYTPFAIKTIAWLARYPQETAHLIWLYLQVASLMLAIFLLARGLEPRLTLPATLIAISLALFSQSLRQLLFWSQSSPLLLLGVAGAWLAMRRRQPAMAGFCLAFVTLIKLYPGLLGGYLLLRRRWRELGWMTVFFALGLVATGVKDWAAFAQAVASPRPRLLHLRGWGGMINRACIWNFVSRATSWLNHGGSSSPAAMLLFGSVVGAGILTLLLLATVRTNDSDPNTDGLVYGLWIAAGLILSPLSWKHEFPLLFPIYLFAIAVVYRTIRHGLPRHNFALVAGVLVLGACIVPELIHQVPPLQPPYLVPIAALLGGMLLLEARRNPGTLAARSSRLNHEPQLEYEPGVSESS